MIIKVSPAKIILKNTINYFALSTTIFTTGLTNIIRLSSSISLNYYNEHQKNIIYEIKTVVEMVSIKSPLDIIYRDIHMESVCRSQFM